MGYMGMEFEEAGFFSLWLYTESLLSHMGRLECATLYYIIFDIGQYSGMFQVDNWLVFIPFQSTKSSTSSLQSSIFSALSTTSRGIFSPSYAAVFSHRISESRLKNCVFIPVYDDPTRRSVLPCDSSPRTCNSSCSATPNRTNVAIAT